MIRAWLDMPPLGIFLILAVLNFGMAGLLTWIVFRSPLRRPLD